MTFKSYPFVGKGDVYIGEVKATYAATLAGLLLVGNCLDAKISTKPTEDKVPSMMLGSSGNYATYEDIDEANIDFTFVDYSPGNLSRALLGNVVDVAGGTVTDEPIKFRHGLILTEHVGISNVVLTDTAGTTTYVKDVDYGVTGAGLIGLDGSAIDVDADLKLDYTYPAQHRIELAAIAGKEYMVVIDGANYAMGGLPQVFKAWRAKFGAGSAVDLITSKIARLPMKAALQPDQTKAGTGISKYAQIIGVKPQ